MRNLLRVVVLALALVFPALYAEQFARHFYAYLTGNILTTVFQGQWGLVALCAVGFVAFLVPLSYRRKAKWAEYGLVAAFFISLFVEMFGIPLTILFASAFVPGPELDLPAHIVNFTLFGWHFGLTAAMVYAVGLIGVGSALIAWAWATLYRAVKRDEVVTTGVYALCRHPQYLGFILVLAGWIVGWPTILTLVMAPILIYKYVSVCRKEEAELDPALYADYRARVPFFF